MNIYLYQAALLCGECGDKCKEEQAPPSNPSDEHSFDSNDFPKGPYASDYNEADNPYHCDHCGVFLENPLTSEGVSSLYRMVLKALKDSKWSNALLEWVDFYNVDLKDIINLSLEESEIS